VTTPPPCTAANIAWGIHWTLPCAQNTHALSLVAGVTGLAGLNVARRAGLEVTLTGRGCVITPSRPTGGLSVKGQSRIQSSVSFATVLSMESGAAGLSGLQTLSHVEREEQSPDTGRVQVQNLCMEERTALENTLRHCLLSCHPVLLTEVGPAGQPGQTAA